MTIPLHDIVPIELGDRSYNIHVGRGLLTRAGELLKPVLGRPRTVTVTDEKVADIYLEQFGRALSEHQIENQNVILPAGEATKSFSQLERLLEELLHLGVERGDTILAFGGGVVGDLAGFAASVLRRGVAFAQIPTTLLAQVDSSVGGKTGINTVHGKNLVGAFYQPKIVLADIDTLKTLPRRDFLSGYAEVLKYALLGDAVFYDWLNQNIDNFLSLDADTLLHAIKTSCIAKAKIVEADEHEAGQRALLNLGHTFAHALEAATGFSEDLTHGEAVAIGQKLAFSFSCDLGYCDENTVGKVSDLLRKMGIRQDLHEIGGYNLSADELLAHMSQDKKVVDGKLTFILVRDIGKAFICHDVDRGKVKRFLEKMVQS